MVGVHIDFNNFKSCWENGVKKDKFVQEGGGGHLTTTL